MLVTQSLLLVKTTRHSVRVNRSLSIIGVLFQPKKKNIGFPAMTDDPYLVKLRKYKRGEGELTKTTRIPLMSEDRRLKEMENTPTLVIKSLGELVGATFLYEGEKVVWFARLNVVHTGSKSVMLKIALKKLTAVKGYCQAK